MKNRNIAGRTPTALIFAFSFFFMVAAVCAQDVSFIVLREEVIDNRPKESKPEQTQSIFPFPVRDVPPGDRRIVFRISNASDEDIVIYGLRYDSTFQPAGFLVPFDANSRKWKEPTPEREAGERRSLSQADKNLLKRGQSMEFSSLLSSTADIDIRFRRTIYFSLDGNKCPVKLQSVEFQLSK